MIDYFRVLGTGTIDWRRWMQVLKAGGWSGWAIEEIDLSPKAVAELRSGLNYFAAELSPIYRSKDVRHAATAAAPNPSSADTGSLLTQP